MNKLKSKQAASRAPLEEAARWFLRLQDQSAHVDTFLEWQRWLSASSAHPSAYEEIESTVLRLSRTAAKPLLPSAEELAEDHYDGSEPIAQWHRRSNLLPQRRTTVWLAAAGLAACLVGSAWLWKEHARELRVGSFAYHTGAGQHRVVELPDGSKITLDANSALQASLRSNERVLTLERGEAFFEVAKDKARPFVVRAGATEVTALGTAFNVRMSADRTVVAVTEGKVEVMTAPKAISRQASAQAAHKATMPRVSAQVSAGEAVSYVENGGLQALPGAATPLATGWLEGRRQYQNEPLRYVLADVDRYTGRHIEVSDEAAGLRFTGTLNPENSKAWLQGLPVALPVKVVERTDGALYVAMRAQP